MDHSNWVLGNVKSVCISLNEISALDRDAAETVDYTQLRRDWLGFLLTSFEVLPYSSIPQRVGLSESWELSV